MVENKNLFYIPVFYPFIFTSSQSKQSRVCSLRKMDIDALLMCGTSKLDAMLAGLEAVALLG
jgi:hypothetical protein